jgi:hypothetical protein
VRVTAVDFAGNMSDYSAQISIAPSPVNSIENLANLPDKYYLEQNCPNPFNPITTIKYGLSQNANVLIKVYNMRGQEVTTLVDASQNAGNHSITWDGKTDTGDQVSSGIYIYHLSTTDFTQTRKMVMLK